MPAKVSGKDVLNRMAHIHGSLAHSAARIEAIVSELLRSAEHGNISVFDLQELDKVRQSLENLQSISQTIADHMPERLAFPKTALKQVMTLGEMEKALLHGSHGKDDDDSSGVHLFD
ncbi:MAG: hypothetical protein JNM45_08010 [Rhizobiales bacterium]|nr:hypothetical protein [Hyphomicrobiales bacterium]